MKKVRLGIIGAGNMGSGHIGNYLKGLLPEIEIVAVADRRPDRRDWARENLGDKVAIFNEGSDLIASGLVDAILIAVPHYQHPVLAVDGFKHNLHVMCEKPMAINTAEAQKMIDAAKRTGKKLTIGYQNRFRPDSRYLKQVCEAGDLGEIYYARAQAIRRRAVPTWGVFLDEEKQGGGPLIDIGTHALDLTLWTMNNYEPEMVVGTKYHKLAPHANSANAWGPWDPEKFTVEDSAFGFVRMKNGATIYLESSWALNTLDVHEAKTILCGDKGGADMMGEGGALRINGERFGKTYVTEPGLGAGGVAFYDGETVSAADLEAKMWIAHVLDDNAPLITKPEQSIVVTKILEAIYTSSATGKPVYFD